jgi:hypothetical protein
MMKLVGPWHLTKFSLLNKFMNCWKMGLLVLIIRNYGMPSYLWRLKFSGDKCTKMQSWLERIWERKIGLITLSVPFVKTLKLKNICFSPVALRGVLGAYVGINTCSRNLWQRLAWFYLSVGQFRQPEIRSSLIVTKWRILSKKNKMKNPYGDCFYLVCLS